MLTSTPSTPTGTVPTPERLATEATLRWFDTLASRRFWLAAAAVFVPFALLFFASSAPFSVSEVSRVCGADAPDMRFFSNGADVDRFLDECGPAGRDTYRNLQLADLFYPAIVGLFMATSLAHVIKRLGPSTAWVRWIAALPIVGSGFDYLENVFAWLALTSYPDPISTNSLLGFASAAKTTTTWLAGLLLLAGLIVLGARSARRVWPPGRQSAEA